MLSSIVVPTTAFATLQRNGKIAAVGMAVTTQQVWAKYTEDRWIVRLYLPDGMVVVWINAQSGKLQNALAQDASISVIPTAQGQKGRTASV